MSLLVVIGTLLPLIEDHVDNATSPAALVTILGLIFAIAGFVASGEKSGTLIMSFQVSTFFMDSTLHDGGRGSS